MHNFSWLLVVSFVLCFAASARADDAANSATAQSLYDDGRRLLQQGRAGEACPKLEASQKLDPAPGTQFHLADCYEKIGRTASAWALFLEVAAQARSRIRAEQEKIARERASALEPKLSKLTFEVAAGARVPGLRVTRNGTEIDAALFGTPISVDPGPQRIVAEAPGYEVATLELSVTGGAQKTVAIPELKKSAEGSGQRSPQAESASNDHTRSDQPGSTERDKPPPRRGLRNASYVALGVGVIGLGAGTFFVLRSASKRNDADDAFEACGSDCLESNPNAERTASLDDEARKARTFATVGFVVGGAALAGGATLFLLSRPSAKAERRTASRAQTSSTTSLHPWIGAGSAGLSGTF